FRRQHRETDDARRFDDRSFRFRFPPPASAARAMGRVDRADRLSSRTEQSAQAFPKAVAAVADRKQLQRIVRPNFTPATRDGFVGRSGSECAFEFVRRDEDCTEHAFVIVPPLAMCNLNSSLVRAPPFVFSLFLLLLLLLPLIILILIVIL